MTTTSSAPLVSIGLPVFNGEVFIVDAVESLLTQTFTDFELIISDNASTDRTREICEDYAQRDKRVRYVRQSENIGALKNFEAVLHLARGTLFMWAACDDLWAENWLEVLVRGRQPGDMSVRGSIRFLRDGEILSERSPRSYARGEWVRFFLEEETSMNGRNFYIYGLFERTALAALDRSVLTEDYYPDYLFTFQMLQLGNLRTLPGTYQTYRLHAESAGTQMAAKRLTRTRLLYQVHPASFYRSYLAIVPAEKKALMTLLVPAKHAYNQGHLWWRGIRKFVLGRENV